jgi:DNA-binding MarR family transcriptional regulator
LWRATLAWQRRINAALAPHELTHVQFVLLASVWWLGRHRPEVALTQARVTEQAGTDPMMASQVIRKLERRGLLTRHRNPSDTRTRLVRMTAAGNAVLAPALADVEAADAEFFAALPDGQAGLIAALRALGG